jgi:hypothetical protein
VQELADTALRWAADVFAVSGAPPPAPPQAASNRNSSSSDSSSPASTPDTKLNALPAPPAANTAAATTHAALKVRFGAQARRIAGAALRLVRVAREEIMSTAFEALRVEPGRAFDPAEMSDAFADAGYAGAVLSGPNSGTAAGGKRTNGHGANGVNGHANGNGKGSDARRWAPQKGERVLCTTEVGLVCSTRKDGPKDKEATAQAKRGDVLQRMVLLKPKVVLESVTRALEG